MSDKLSDCPFCGSEYTSLNTGGSYYVMCGNCGAEGPWNDDDRDIAIAAWNRRASPVPAILAELRGLLVECRKNLDRLGHAGIRERLTAQIDAIDAAPAISESEDAKRLDFIAAESVDLVSFAIPYEDDADIGWRVLQHHIGEAEPRVIGEVFRDDPRAAIDAARNEGAA
ncbi:Lar family restriction alleviation protein [Burkholderia gladioli]|uniref:Lar family restriction alleviation protein n=1 Tax=Burkholderia gladioli TaxID=28095 RepID=UPI0016412FF9|nr:Lar family restriction alleviation protein [Burkholderia gladioli]